MHYFFSVPCPKLGYIFPPPRRYYNRDHLSVRLSFLPSVCQQDYADTTRLIILKKINSKGIYVTQIPFSFQLHSLHSLDTKIINDLDWPIDFLLGGAKNFQIGGGMHSPSSCSSFLFQGQIYIFSSEINISFQKSFEPFTDLSIK